MSRRNHSRTLGPVEVLVAVFVCAYFLVIVGPASQKSRFDAYRAQCQKNLSEIGKAMQIYTNEVDSTDVTTNYVPAAQGTATFTNSVVINTTTNDTTAQVYDWQDFGDGWTFEYGDIATFTFDCTNALYLIRVYDEYVRP